MSDLPFGDDFLLSAAQAFSFLEEQHGFRRSGTDEVGYGRWITYEKPAVKIRVQHELGSAPWVSLETPDPLEPGLRREFDLHELEQEMSKRGLYQKRVTAPASIAESLNELAATLQAIGADVLNGNFEILLDRRRRHVEAVRRNREKR